MSTSRFERDTAVEQVEEGRYRGDIVEGWSVSPVGSVPNGGYLLAMAARAMRAGGGRGRGGAAGKPPPGSARRGGFRCSP